MNTSTFFPTSFPRLLPALILACIVPLTLHAQESSGEKSVAQKTETPPATEQTEPAKPKHALPPALEEVVKMSESGVSTDVLLQFVETSPTAARPTGPDIIAMKDRGVPDAVIVTLMHRGAQAANRPNPSRDSIAAPVIVRTMATDGQLDPESYEFFWYHHMYPRALENSYERLTPYHPSSQPQGYGGGYPVYTSQRIPWRTSGFPKESFTPGKSRGQT